LVINIHYIIIILSFKNFKEKMMMIIVG